MRRCEPKGQCWHDVWVTLQVVKMTSHLKKSTGTPQFNTTQLSAFYFCVTRTTGNPVYARGASSFLKGVVASLFFLSRNVWPYCKKIIFLITSSPSLPLFFYRFHLRNLVGMTLPYEALVSRSSSGKYTERP